MPLRTFGGTEIGPNFGTHIGQITDLIGGLDEASVVPLTASSAASRDKEDTTMPL